MRRAALRVVMVLAALHLSAGAARAACDEDVRALRSKVPAVKDGPKRAELTKLLDKAAKDATAGRTRLCEDAVQHALVLLK